MKVKHYANYHELYTYLVAFAAMLLVLRIVAENTRYLEIP